MLVIFDLDGPLRYISWRGLARAYLMISIYRGRNPIRFFTRKEDSKKINEIFHTHYDRYTHIFPWAEEILETLSKKHTLALFSNSSSYSIKASLGNLDRLFSSIVGRDHLKKIKPDPEGIHLIIKQLNADPKTTIIVGDRKEDILAGQRADVKTGAVRWGGGKLRGMLNWWRARRWKRSPHMTPDHIFIKPEDLLSI